MKLSLMCINIRLNLPSSQLILCCNENPRFQNVRLYQNQDASQLDPEILYICDAPVPPCCLHLPGLVCLNPSNIPVNYDKARIELHTPVERVYLLDLISDIFRIYNRWEMDIIESIFRKKSLQDLVNITGALLHNPCYILNDSLQIIASVKDTKLEKISDIWKFQAEHKYWPVEQMMSMLDTVILTQLKNSSHAKIFMPASFRMPCCAISVKNDKIVYGYIYIIEAYQKLDQPDIEILERLAPLIGYFLTCSNENISLQTGMYYERFLLDIIDGKYKDQPAQFDRQLQLVRLWNETSFQVMTLDVWLQEDSDLLFLLINIFNNELKGKVFCRDKRVNCLFSRQQSPDFEKKAVYYLKRLSICCGISETFSDLIDLEYYYHQALTALKYGAKASEQPVISHYSDYFPLHMGHVLKNVLRKDYLWSSQISRLASYDEKHETDYIQTLFLYLQNERNISRTAKALHMHRNSLMYRLNKIDSILHVDLDEPSVRMRILLELYALYSEQSLN